MGNSYTFTVEDILKASKEKEEEKTPETSSATATAKASALSEETPKQQLLNDLAAIDKKYGFSGGDNGYSDSLGLDKIEYNAPSDDDIKVQAESELTSKKIAGENSINTDTDKKIEDYNEYKTNEEKSAEELLKELEKQYEERKVSASNEALKRGLARSSIIMNRIEDFDKGKIDSEIKIKSDLSETLNKIDYKISSLETAREKALADFDIEYAAELTKKLNELKDERQKKTDDALKYNNTVTEKEASYQADKAAAEQKALESYLKNKDQYEQLVLEEKLQTVKAYYDAMPAQEALNDFLKDSTMQRALKEYYDYMLLYLKVKASK